MLSETVKHQTLTWLVRKVGDLQEELHKCKQKQVELCIGSEE